MSVGVKDIAASRLRIHQVIHRPIQHLLPYIVLIYDQVASLFGIEAIFACNASHFIFHLGLACAFDPIEHGLLHAFDLDAQVVQLLNLPILDQTLLAVNGCVWSTEGGQATPGVGAPDECHCVILLDLLRAGQNGHHVRRLLRILLAIADAARLSDGAARLVRGDVRCVGLHCVRVARMHSLVRGLVQILLAKLVAVLSGADAPLPRFKGYFIAAALAVMAGGWHAGCGAATELLVVELERHTVVVLLATLLQQLLLDACARS